MFVKVNTTSTLSLMVTDINGDRVINDNPVAIIKDKINNKFFNGLFWIDSPCEVIMQHVSNGVYSVKFTPDVISVFDIELKSESYSISRYENIESYNEDAMTYEWTVNSEFLINCNSSSENVEVEILRNFDKTYYNGADWVVGKTTVQMSKLQDDVFVFAFTPNLESKYVITILGDSPQIFVIDVKETSKSIAPLLISNKNLKSQDGTDCTILSQNGTPISGVKISCYDYNTKDIECCTQTGINGEWSMMIRPGKYIFIFDKIGYSSVSLERQVL